MTRPPLIEDLPRHFAEFIARLAQDCEPEVKLAAELTSRASLEGAVCLDLRPYANRPWPDNEERTEDLLPDLPTWMSTLRRSTAVGAPGDFRPLILTDSARLYLHRYWEYEDKLAENLARRAREDPPLDDRSLREAWAALPFREELSEEQVIAALSAILRNLTIISGGAGTGKTTIVACILKLLASQSDPTRLLRVRLAAPTGKAAGRLKEQLRESRRRLDPEGAIDALLKEDPATLHRLLGGAPTSSRFRHHPDNPLPIDVLIIDEASMVDLPMMSKVGLALPKNARLVLIGDRDQLPPVGIGSVFGDLCRAPSSPPEKIRGRIQEIIERELSEKAPAIAKDATVAGSVTLLERSFRFTSESGIGRLATAIRKAQDQELSDLRRSAPADLDWLEVEPQSGHRIDPGALAYANEGFAPFLDAVRRRASPAEVLDAFDQFRVLCVGREGPAGVTEWNLRLSEQIRQRHRLWASQVWFEGRPVLVTRNDYGQRLWNGDIGVTLWDPEDNALRVYFRGAENELRDFPPGRLAHVETAYALTVHKSQGSEFDRVLLVLPAGESRLLRRELLYTGTTRARRRLGIVGGPEQFAHGMRAGLPRTSGLADALEIPGAQAPAVQKVPSSPVGQPRQGELF